MRSPKFIPNPNPNPNLFPSPSLILAAGPSHLTGLPPHPAGLPRPISLQRLTVPPPPSLSAPAIPRSLRVHRPSLLPLPPSTPATDATTGRLLPHLPRRPLSHHSSQYLQLLRPRARRRRPPDLAVTVPTPPPLLSPTSSSTPPLSVGHHPPCIPSLSHILHPRDNHHLLPAATVAWSLRRPPPSWPSLARHVPPISTITADHHADPASLPSFIYGHHNTDQPPHLPFPLAANLHDPILCKPTWPCPCPTTSLADLPPPAPAPPATSIASPTPPHRPPVPLPPSPSSTQNQQVLIRVIITPCSQH